MVGVNSCRACGSPLQAPFLDLGVVPLANNILRRDQLKCQEPKYALATTYCSNCSLVQLTENVSPKDMFEHYVYRSSYSDTMLSHVRKLASELVVRERLNDKSLVVEVASNDGYLLKNYIEHGVPVLGIDPAANIAEIAEKEAGVPTLVEFFNKDIAQGLVNQGKQADIIHAHNVLAHVPDPNELIGGFSVLLKETGIAVVEVPYVRDLIEKLEFDTIYHEHYSYFSLIALNNLAIANGLIIKDVQRVEIHGGSLRVEFSKPNVVASPRVAEFLAEEQEAGIGDEGFYALFATKVAEFKQEFVKLLQSLKDEGASIAAYGASAKGSTLLSYTEIGPETLDFVADRSLLKQDHYSPGGHIPIVSTEEVLKQKPDYLLLLAWNFADEIIAQQAGYSEQGGKFIVPLPELKII
ncbi:class I SAM-dependent methyltransferase [Terasakiella pusilla]|uniref:class I SAM-dependent methyltransferase n=1 Tax=Terasakiella pusilla TaxID=64973 RepID=UPI003AA84B32